MKQVVKVNEEKCVNCYACIAACPVKYCMDGSGDVLRINDELCVGCGACIAACTHEARSFVDDTQEFLNAPANCIAVVAPAVASVFADSYLNLNGWLKSIGVKAVFDVSFGAELTVVSYLKHLAAHNPELIIAQPCPALVTYIEIYKPELLPCLAPAHSPMLHTIAMVKEYYPEYKDCKVAVVSPCIAKGREYEETGLGDYNVTMLALKQYFDTEHINLSAFPKIPYEGPAAERAVLFPVPGGLLETAERTVPGISKKSRKIEGVRTIYPYFDELANSITTQSGGKKKRHPLLVDCLSCEKGCVGGPGTGNALKGFDEIELPVEERADEAEDAVSKKWKKKAAKKYDHALEKYWKKDIYNRSYVNRSNINTTKMPNDAELDTIYKQMRKFEKKDFYDCGSCGYGSCKGMAVAIYNQLNKVENCHHYNMAMIREKETEISALNKRMEAQLEHSVSALDTIKSMMNTQQDNVNKQSASVENSSNVVTGMVEKLHSTSTEATKRFAAVQTIVTEIAQGQESMAETIKAVSDISTEVQGITDAIKTISGIAANTNLLAMNAAIEAAHAGQAGAGFAVVADEIRKLSETTGTNSKAISQILNTIVNGIGHTAKCSNETSEAISKMAEETKNFAALMNTLTETFADLSRQTDAITQTLTDLKNVSNNVQTNQAEMLKRTDDLQKHLEVTE
ncbi:MAG: methyl-accepting chemotaxis protein [Spirochaetaceae bacterium]|nr:methyl-accepting chemotaxis protein [Spirochaetaceae bacterium]